ncbi:MAG: hypothetical protein WA459_23505 [Stellaceae bacterium]
MPDSRASFSSFVSSMPYLTYPMLDDYTPIRPVPGQTAFWDAKLLKCGDPVVEANALCDPAVLDADHRRPRKPYLSARRRRETSENR